MTSSAIPPTEAIPRRPAVRARLRRRPSGEAPPLPHKINASGKWWAALAVVFVASFSAIVLTPAASKTLDVLDHAILVWIADIRADWLTPVMRALGWPATGLALQLLWLSNLILLLIWKRWRHLIVWIAAGLIVNNLVWNLAGLLERPRPFGIEILGDWKGFAMPSLPLAMLATFLVSTLYSNVPAGRPRQIGKIVATAILVIVTLSRLYLAQDAPSDALCGVVIGVAIPLVLFRVFVPNDVFPVSYHRGRTAHLTIDERRHDAIVHAMEDQLGLLVLEIKPFGLEGSGGSTPLRVKIKSTDEADAYVLAKLYAANHLRADRWYKLGRTLLYGRLEDEKAFNTVRRLVQYEDYLLRLFYHSRIKAPKPYGIAELTPEREYLLVMEFFDNATEIGVAEIDDDIIDQGLMTVRRMWDVGLAHRDIKPANLLLRDGQLVVVDCAFAQIRPSPWRQAVDLANMMLVLALRTDTRRVYDRARVYFTDEEIVEAFAATRGLTMPSQLRQSLRNESHDIHAEFLQMLPYQLPPIRIQRWSIRRVVLTVFVLACVVIAGLMAAQLVINNPL
jgi:serine/threonine-protein kinase RIO1